MSVAILVPVLDRPQNVAPLVDSIYATTPEPCRILFICDPDDRPEQDAIAAAGCDMISPGGSYAAKVAAGVAATSEPLLFLGADDLIFRAGWFEAAQAKLVDGIEVVGVNDLLDRPTRPQHATHFLMSRDYAQRPTIDGGRGPMHAGYSHWFCDDELIATAMKRGVYVYAADSHVQHLHPMGGTAEDDETYRKGRERRRLDRKHFQRRERLWI